MCRESVGKVRESVGKRERTKILYNAPKQININSDESIVRLIADHSRIENVCLDKLAVVNKGKMHVPHTHFVLLRKRTGSR